MYIYICIWSDISNHVHLSLPYADYSKQDYGTIKNREYDEILNSVHKLSICLIIIECWNWACLLIPIWSVFFFLQYTRPGEQYFYEFFITPEAIDKVQPIVQAVIQLIFQIQSLDPTVNVKVKRAALCEDEYQEVPLSEVQLMRIFREENVAPLFAAIQIFGFLLIYVLVFIHFMFIKCICRVAVLDHMCWAVMI